MAVTRSSFGTTGNGTRVSLEVARGTGLRMAELRWNASLLMRLFTCVWHAVTPMARWVSSLTVRAKVPCHLTTRGSGVEAQDTECVMKKRLRVPRLQLPRAGVAWMDFACGLTDSVLCLHFKTSSLGSVVMTAKSWRGPNTPRAYLNALATQTVPWCGGPMTAPMRCTRRATCCEAVQLQTMPTRALCTCGCRRILYLRTMCLVTKPRGSGSTMASSRAPHARNCVIFWTIMMRLCLVGIPLVMVL